MWRDSLTAKTDFRAVAVTSLAMFGFWLALSGHFDGFHLLGGVCSAIVVAFLSHDLLFPGETGGVLRKTWRFLLYVPWLLLEILKAGIDVAYRVLHPSMPIKPAIVKFQAPFEGDMARTILSNSITLTPGTITIEVKGREFIVHSLSEEMSKDLVEGTMQARIARIFEEGAGR